MVLFCALHGINYTWDKTHKILWRCYHAQLCRNDTVINKLRTNKQDVIARFKTVHGDKYNYSKVEHVDMTTPITILCSIHGEFTQLPVAHVSGQGCPSCAKTGFDTNKSAILYYLKITTESNEILYKIR